MDTRDDCRKTALKYFLAAEESADPEATIIYLESAQHWMRLAARGKGADYGMLAQADAPAANRDPSSGGCLVRGVIYKGLSEFWTRPSVQSRRH
jgi:hypothetical protein